MNFQQGGENEDLSDEGKQIVVKKIIEVSEKVYNDKLK